MWGSVALAMRVGILQAGHAPDEVKREHGDFSDMFERLLSPRGLDLDVFNVVDLELPRDVGAADGWLITGSLHGAYEDHAFIPPLESFIRSCYAEGVPLIGICFGHQIVAQALGGRVEKFSLGWSVGRVVYRFGAEEIALNAWHQDQVVRLPPDAEPIASSSFCAYAALQYGRRVLTIQGHPEFSSEVVATLIRTTRDVPEPLLEQARKTLGEPTASGLIADRLVRFLRRGPPNELHERHLDPTVER